MHELTSSSISDTEETQPVETTKEILPQTDKKAAEQTNPNQHPIAFPEYDLNESIKSLPLIPVLTLETEERDGGNAVILTWDVKKAKPDVDSDDLSESEWDEETENLLKSIKEYELFGYREDLLNENKTPWTSVKTNNC